MYKNIDEMHKINTDIYFFLQTDYNVIVTNKIVQTTDFQYFTPCYNFNKIFCNNLKLQ